MARVTVEDCLEREENRFALVILAAYRTRQLMKGATPLVHSKNKAAVTALREIVHRVEVTGDGGVEDEHRLMTRGRGRQALERREPDRPLGIGTTDSRAAWRRNSRHAPRD